MVDNNNFLVGAYTKISMSNDALKWMGVYSLYGFYICDVDEKYIKNNSEYYKYLLMITKIQEL